MKKRIINYLFVCLFATTMQTVSAQHTLIKEDFTFVVDEDHSMWTRVSANGTRQFYNNDDGLAVYHGDVILSGANIDNASFGGGANYAKETLNLKMDGKLHYEEGKLDGPFSIKYTFGNTADGKETNAYGRANRVRGRLNVTYSISGAFDKGYATGTWQISHERTEVTNGTKTSKYTITVKYDKGKIVSYVKNTNGEVVTLDKNGNVSGTIGKCNIRHGLELPNNDKVGDELAALMERGQFDSAICKGVDYHYHFYRPDNLIGYSRTFRYDILNSTIEGLFVILGGIENPIAQFKGESRYFLHEKNDRRPYYTYDQLVEFLKKGHIASIYRSMQPKAHQLLSSGSLFDGYITSTVVDRLKPHVDSLMKESVINNLKPTLIKGLKEVLSEKRTNWDWDLKILSDTIYNRIGDFDSYYLNENKLTYFDTLDTGIIAVPLTINYADKKNQKIKESYRTWIAVGFGLKTMDKVRWKVGGPYHNSPEGIFFSTTELVKIPNMWDTIAPLLREWDDLMALTEKYKGTTPDFNKQLNLISLNKNLEAISDARGNYQFLTKWLPKAKVFCAALSTDHEAYLLLKEIEGKSNLTPEISEYLKRTDYYASVKSEEQMTAQSKQLKQYYTDLLSYLNYLDQREPNHNKIIEKKKSAKNIVKIYNEYYLGIQYDWDEEMTALPALEKLIENQKKLLELLNRADIEDINKQVKKNKYKTVDEILSM